MVQAVTFPIVQDADGNRFRRNAETGVEIHPQRLYGVKGNRYIVTAPTLTGYDVVDDELTLNAARAWATERAELMREVIADAVEAAAEENRAPGTAVR